MMRNTLRRLLCICLILALALSLAACDNKPETASSDAGASGAEPGTATDNSTVYNGLFDTSRVHTVDITISEDDWSDLRSNPMDKTKYETTVVIDGETVNQVSFSTKGNTSLSFVASDPESDRYSFKLNFGKFVKGQTYHGLNKLSLNNLYADATLMKDFLSYGLFQKAGVDAPLVSYVWLTVNGADHGLYIAIEDVSEAWLARTQNGEGVLYKPETEGLNMMGEPPEGFPEGFPGFPGMPGGNGNGQFPAPPDASGQPGTPPDASGQPGTPPDASGQPGTPPDASGQPGTPPDASGQPATPPDGNGQGGVPGGFSGGVPGGFPGGVPGGFPGGVPGGFPGGMPPEGFPAGPFGNAKGADLRYTDDDPDSYSDIFDNAETDADDDAPQRVIAALKGLSEGRAKDVLDTDEVVRYFAVHNFVLNYDSYTGGMLHNYYLYENGGRLSMLPWDYNLAFGAFAAMGMGGEMNDATALINTGIDTPLFGAAEESRPMWSWIVNDEQTLSAYHAAYEELLTYFESGDFEQELERLRTMLQPYVEKDPTAFYTAEEFGTAVETLRRVCLLRAQSIRAQLEGTLATRTEEQDAAARVDASDVILPSMGTHGGPQGPMGFEGFEGFGNPNGKQE